MIQIRPAEELSLQLRRLREMTAAEMSAVIERALRRGEMPPDAAALQRFGFLDREIRDHRHAAVRAARRAIQAEGGKQ